MPIQKWSDRIWIVRLSDEPALSDDLQATAHEAGQAAVYPSVVIDFSAVSRLTSSNLSQLLRLRKQAIDNDSKIKLSSLNDSIWVVFLTTGLDQVFEFAPDLSTALAGLQLEQT